MARKKAPAKRGPVRRYAGRKQPDEPSVEAGLWLSCEDSEFETFEQASTSEGIDWTNRWAMMHLNNVATTGKSRRYPFTRLEKPADHIKPANRASDTGVFIPSRSHREAYERAATVEGFGNIRDWGLHHLRNIASAGTTQSETKAKAA